MDLILLDPVTFTERGRFDSYESLVWNEKYQTRGDFQLQTSDIELALKVFNEYKYFAIDTSSTVMRVKDRNYSMGEDGKITLQINGVTVDEVYHHRPAVPMIAASTQLHLEYPEGWVIGDVLSDEYDLEPSTVAKQLLTEIDEKHYNRPELSYVQTPFNIINFTSITNQDFQQELMNHHVIQSSSTAGDVLDEMMRRGNYHATLVRPDFNWKIPPGYEKKDRPIAYVMKHPQIRKDVVFSYYNSDYSAYSHTNDLSTVKTEVLNAFEDGVLRSRIDPDAQGLDVRIKYFETDIADYLEGQGNLHIAKTFAGETVQESIGSSTIDLLISEPMDGKRLFMPFYENDRCYYLGDLVYFLVPWEKDPVLKQVTEYVKVQDLSGYKEYPRFNDFVETSGYRISYDKRWWDGAQGVKTQAKAYSKLYAKLLDNVRIEDKWV